MPHRITEVFGLDKDSEKGKSRYNRLCSFSYSNDELAQAERIPIVDGALPVEDDELLVRILESPTSVFSVEMGLEYTPGAFGDASKWGLSVQRIGMTTVEAVNCFGGAKALSKGRKYVGFAEAVAGALRSGVSLQTKRRLLGVFATPDNDTPAHADVYLVIVPSREEKEVIKALFWSAFNLDKVVQRLGIA